MSYEAALEKAWEKLKSAEDNQIQKVKFLNDTYQIDKNSHKIISLSCNVPAPTHISILILHYVVAKSKSLPGITGEWLSFKELPGGQAYYDAFQKRALDPIARKYGKSPEGLIECLERLPGKKIQYGDIGIFLEVFENVPVLVTIWGQDEEFSAESNILFDRSIKDIFCTEDIAVLSDIIARVV